VTTSPDSVTYPTVGYGVVGYTLDGTGFKNYITLDASDTGAPVVVQARGLDDNIDIALSPKGTGGYIIGNNWPQWWVISGSATYPTITVDGALADIDAKVYGKGEGYLNTTKLFIGSAAVRPLIDPKTTVYMRTTTNLYGSGWSAWSATGNFTGTITSSLSGLYLIGVDADTVNATGQGIDILRVYSVQTGGTGARVGLSSSHIISSAVSVQDNQFHVGLFGSYRAEAAMGGQANNPRGNIFGFNTIGGLRRGAQSNVNSVVGAEINTFIDLYTPPLWHITMQLVPGGDITTTTHAGRGSHIDTALAIAEVATATAQYRTGITFGAPNGTWAFATDSQLITTLPTALAGGGGSYVAADGIAWKDITFGRVYYEFANASLDSDGNSGAQVAGGVTLQARDGVYAKTAVVASWTVIDGGLFSGSGAAPTLVVDDPPSSGTTATAAIATCGAGRVQDIPAGGSGYAVDNILTVVGGTGTATTLRVRGVDANGAVTAAVIESAGSYSVRPGTGATTTGGAGTGCTVSLSWTVLTITNSGAGTNYPQYPAPKIRFSGGTVFRKLVAKVAMTATQTTLKLNNGKINVTGIPTSAVGLNSGDIYSNAGILTVVP